MWIGPVIIAAAIAAMVNVLGWFVGSWRDRRADDHCRQEKQDDMATALPAKTTHSGDALAFFDLDDVRDRGNAKMTEDASYVPFIPSERNDTIKSAPQKLRQAVYTDYIALKKQASEDGNSAISALAAHLLVSGARLTLAKDGAR